MEAAIYVLGLDWSVVLAPWGAFFSLMVVSITMFGFLVLDECLQVFPGYMREEWGGAQQEEVVEAQPLHKWSPRPFLHRGLLRVDGDMDFWPSVDEEKESVTWAHTWVEDPWLVLEQKEDDSPVWVKEENRPLLYNEWMVFKYADA